MTHLVLCVVVVSSFSASEGRVYMKCVFVCETLKGISGSGRHVVPPLGPPLNVLLSTIFIKRKQEMHLFIPATILHSSSCYLSTANDIVLNYLACCLYFVLTCIPPNLNSQAPIWATRREAQLVTDPATSAIWYIGGATNGGDTNEVDKFLSDAWNTNVPTVKKDAGSSGTGSPAIMGSYSAGTSHLIDGKIYIFGGFASAASSPRTYQTFQNLPWLDISTTPPTIGTQVRFFLFFIEGGRLTGLEQLFSVVPKILTPKAHNFFSNLDQFFFLVYTGRCSTPTARPLQCPQ